MDVGRKQWGRNGLRVSGLNRDNAAIQVKLDEIIRASQVRNSFIGIEHLSDEEIEDLRRKTERSAAGEADDRAVEDVGEKARHAADSISG
jgi:low affinity Fe/Cu permease